MEKVVQVFGCYGMVAICPVRLENPTHWKTLTKNSVELQLPDKGLYQFEVNGYDREKNKIATIKPKTIKILPPKRLPAMQSLVGSNLNARGDGSANVKWASLKRASTYEMTILNLQTNKSEKKSMKAPVTKLNGLRPGQYKVSIVGVDKSGRKGQKGAPIILKVPSVSAIQAPKISIIQMD
jgi:hypothetical protein